MIATMIATVMLVQAPISADLRSAYVNCLKAAVASAKGASVAADGFKDYAHQSCATAEDGLKSKLAAFNVKNGMSKKSANADAELQLDDYVYTATERYRFSLEAPK